MRPCCLATRLCGNGLAGLVARSIPLVIPRAHDCITLFLGSRSVTKSTFAHTPASTSRPPAGSSAARAPDTQLSLAFDDLVARYGEEDARYLFEELTRHYRQLTFIRMGVEPDDRFERSAREEAAGRGWDFETVQGDMGLIQRLVDGPWSEGEFLVTLPGSRVVASHDGRIIRMERD